jgi:hypothetical protein
MSRLIKQSALISTTHLPPLPVVDWGSIGQVAPQLIPFDYKGPNESLPQADIVVITWTSAEWSALDHVFANSQTTRTNSDTKWRSQWFLYSKNAPKSTSPDLWGYFRLVSVKNSSGLIQTILLFKSESHLAHPNYITGLSQMVQCIIADVQPKQIYSIGTAGGSSLSEILGDTVVTNSGHIILKLSENTSVGYNNQTFSCNTWYPSFDLQTEVENNLLMPLTTVLTPDELNNLIDQLHKEQPDSANFGLNDLVNAPLDPDNLKNPKILPCKDIPLLTTDYYFIASGDDSSQYSTLEMDDTVVGHEAGLLNVDYVYVRNISDPIVASVSASNEPIPDDVRESWSGLIYQTCGFYTSFNGALTAWACIAG